MDADGSTFIESGSYKYYLESWIKQEGIDGERVEIINTDSVVASYPRISLDMKLLNEFPMQ